MADIKPIETFYNGYRFRSRLEARWAVFFDAMGIEYLYEYEGFERSFDDGTIIRYLPDFYLPNYQMFAEVKGVNSIGEIPSEDAIKMSWMIDYDGPCKNGIILLGNIPDPEGAVSMEYAVWRWTGKGLEFGYSFLPDQKLWIVGGHSADSAPYYFSKTNDYVLTTAIHREFSVRNRISRSLARARQARFEHGEKPERERIPFDD